jgi:trehalose-6-phosphate synthase
METFNIEIINPKAKSILKGLANLNLIKIQKSKPTNEFSELLKKLRNNTEPPLSLDEIAKEVEAVRSKRYGR